VGVEENPTDGSFTLSVLFIIGIVWIIDKLKRRRK
jgi:hypothetical protein